jgi:N-glycosylase/DNA lyase
MQSQYLTPSIGTNACGYRQVSLDILGENQIGKHGLTRIEGDELMELVDRFQSITKHELAKVYKSRVRFNNRKAKFGLSAYHSLREIIIVIDTITMSPREKRDWLYENVCGLGMKEASHFLRNLGKDGGELAILDVHILKHMEHPRNFVKNRKEYLRLEQQFIRMAEVRGKTAGDFDTEIWEASKR